jgi:CheY-like chemotaxis protein
MLGDREKCIEAGASDYIAKPVEIDDLLAMLSRLLLGEKSGQAG